MLLGKLIMALLRLATPMPLNLLCTLMAKLVDLWATSLLVKELAQFNGTANDLEGLVNYTLMMQPMIVGAMVKETDGKVRLSFRAKYDFDVNVFAHKYFGGGGHTQASGATSPYDFNTSLKVLEENMLKELSSHIKNKE